ncbi:MAG: beta-ketoacyl synthase N-terminal-like domain-containing protein [Thermoanaerobaculia bacterium]
MDEIDETIGDERTGREIAVVGMAGRFPGARDLDAFWRNLREGEEAVTPLTDDELRRSGVSESLLAHPDYVKAASLIDDPDLFDASFFGYTAAEAEIMDPQQRLFLEHAWEALEDSGYSPSGFDGLIGVYAGVGWDTYLLSNLREHPELFEGGGGFQVFITNDKDFMPTRVSYKLDLKGPSVIVQTSCSTSLVAVHLACLSLLNYECDMALVGGVTVKVPQRAGYLYQEGGLASPDGHCRAFDAGAAGTIFGSGAGVVVLKRLEEALEDGDSVRAVVKGSAINNDGSTKVSYTAPSVEGQAEVIAAAQEVAEVDPETIRYVETHGTGTSLGDPIEVSALTRVFRQSTEEKGFCALGSVKTNVGHLDAAAGIAGFIKTVLALENWELPPSLNFGEPNPAIDFASSPFYVNAERAGWPADGAPRRAGVSSFGVGGTNAHVILEEAPAPEPSDPPRPWQLLVLSGRSEGALEEAARRLQARLEADDGLDGPGLADAAYTLAAGRAVFRHRRALVCRDRADALDVLAGRSPGRLLAGVDTDEPRDRAVVFLFPGQGSQHAGMARELHAHEPVFRRELDRAAEHLDPELRDLLLDPDADGPEAARRLEETRFAQPALFAVEHALARLWMEWGVRPRAMLGHSIGEYVAAALAGVFTFEEGLALVSARGRLMQECPPGAMLAVPLPEEELRPLLPDEVSLAAVNEPARSVVSGPREALDALAEELAGRDVACRPLHTSHAFHSAMMDPVVEPFAEEVRKLELRPPEIPFLSNTSGTWVTVEQATDPDYWVRHLRQPVRFAQGVEELLGERDRILLEVGPGRTLSTLARRHPARDGQLVAPSLPHPRDEGSALAHLRGALGRLWLAGVRIDWDGVFRGERRRRLSLPTYPFERQRYWIEGAGAAGGGARRPARRSGPLEKRPDPGDWLYLPGWRREPPPAEAGSESRAEPGERSRPVLLLVPPADGDDGAPGTGRRLADRLAERLAEVGVAGGRRVVAVEPGEGFRALGDDRYAVAPASEEDFTALLEALGDTPPAEVVHAWSLDPAAEAAEDRDAAEAALETGFYSLLFLARALTRALARGPVEEPDGDGGPADSEPFGVGLTVLADRLEAVTPAEPLVPERAPLLGLVRVLPQEHPELAIRAVDVQIPTGSGPASERALGQLARALAREIETPAGESLVAFRGRQRWVPEFEPLPAGDTGGDGPPLRSRGVYLLTGGLEGNGLALARFLAREHRARLVLLEPEGPGAEAGEGGDGAEEAAPGGDRVEALRRLGAEVVIEPADLADARSVAEAVRRAEERFGAIHGVLHTAGTQGERTFRMLAEAGREECGWHFEAKIRPLFALDRALEGRELDFAVAVSSLASVLGGLAYGPYTAANLFMDAFARERSRRGGLPWRSLNWDVWRFEDEREQITEVRSDLAELAMTPGEGEEAFRRALAVDGAAQVLVSTADLAHRIEDSEERVRSRLGAAGVEGRPGSLHPRPELETPYAPPGSDVERKIAAVWGRALGFEEVGLDDNFFDLGGDSFLAVQVVSKLRDELGVDLPTAQLYQGLTVRSLADFLEDGEQAAERRAAQLEERRASMERRRELIERRRARRKG